MKEVISKIELKLAETCREIILHIAKRESNTEKLNMARKTVKINMIVASTFG